MSLQSQLLKEGTRHLAGVDEAVLKNIDAVRDMSKISRTSLGPQGMNKMVITANDKLFVTNDASTILRELDVFHPAGRLVLMNSTRLEEEVGDATNFMVAFTGELLTHAESLLRMGLHISDIITGFEKAGLKASELLKSLTVASIEDFTSEAEVTKFIRTSIMGKQYGYEDVLAPAVAKACVSILPKNVGAFDVDSVRVEKLPGGGVSDISVVKGMVVMRDAEGTIKKRSNAKVAVFGGGLDFGKPESKDTWLVTSADQLEGFQKAQEDQMERVVKDIKESGTDVVVVHGKIGELAMHFLERYGLMVVKLNSKFDVMRICKVVGGAPVLRFGGPTPDEMGFIESVRVEEIGSTKVVIFEQGKEHASRLSTILLRGATENILDDIERAVDDGIHTFKTMTKPSADAHSLHRAFVAGAGACEIALATKITHLGEAITGQDQYAYKKFAEALEVVPRTLAENAGQDATLLISNLYAAHAAGNASAGINVETGEIYNAAENGILDHAGTKQLAITLATDAAVSVLKIDQILMSRPATGPKPPKQGPVDGGPDF